MFFWVRFEDRASGTIEGDGGSLGLEAATTDARERAGEFGTVHALDVLPYPSEPRLDVRSECPSFCYRPNQCKGRTACPTAPSCTS